MSETKSVRLDKDIMNTLAEKREGFETPNECLKRLLEGQLRPCVDKVEDSNES